MTPRLRVLKFSSDVTSSNFSRFYFFRWDAWNVLESSGIFDRNSTSESSMLHSLMRYDKLDICKLDIAPI